MTMSKRKEKQNRKSTKPYAQHLISDSTSKNKAGYVIDFFKGCLVPDMCRYC